MKAEQQVLQASYGHTLDATKQTVTNTKIALWNNPHVYTQKPGVRQETGNRPLMERMLYFSSLLAFKADYLIIGNQLFITYRTIRLAVYNKVFIFPSIFSTWNWIWAERQRSSKSLFVFAFYLIAADALPRQCVNTEIKTFSCLSAEHFFYACY